MVRRLGPTTDTRDLAGRLNAAGLTTRPRQPFDAAAVQWILRTPTRSQHPTLYAPGELSVAQAADRLGCSTGVVYYWLKTGQFTARRGAGQPAPASPGPARSRPTAGPASLNPATCTADTDPSRPPHQEHSIAESPAARVKPDASPGRTPAHAEARRERQWTTWHRSHQQVTERASPAQTTSTPASNPFRTRGCRRGSMNRPSLPAWTGWFSRPVAQVLTPVFDPHFSESPFGFRPGRSAASGAPRVARSAARGRPRMGRRH